MQSPNIEKTAIKTSVITIIVNFMLTVFKLIAGIFGASMALISDAVHSASDVFSTVIVIAGVKVSAKKADKKHPFGHERFECVAAIVLAVVLLATGLIIGYTGVKNIVAGEYLNFETPKLIALIAAAVSIVVKEGMFWYTIIAAKKVNSAALRADASIGSLVGVVGAMYGVPVLDSVACLVICLMIAFAAIKIFIDAINKMTDEACDDKTENDIRGFINSCGGVKRIDDLMTRKFGNRIYVIAEIACDKNLPLYEAHEIAETVHKGIEENFPLIKHVTVHVNPYDEKEDADKNPTESDINEIKEKAD